MVKEYLVPIAVTLAALVIYNMFVKKALKIDAYDSE
jgi:hypothetical protein